ncbi:MAG TPA: hypothetical protein VLV83_02220 [Acidobacteriota bacterium]|nr:hypothetical protein [Acidobacteriota bacterium]
MWKSVVALGFVTFAALAGSWHQGAQKCCTGETPDYEVFEKTADSITGWIRFRVGVSDYPDVAALKQIVCDVLRDENLEDFSSVNIFVHDIHTLGTPREIEIIAAYLWNQLTVDKPSTMQLRIYQDADGNYYPPDERPRFRFVHEADCED